jgi:DNA topoisomerase-1
MAKSLIVVESPTKVKTIKKNLGGDYDVVASMGHIKDLPKSTLGIDLENNFEPTYNIIEA